MKSVTAIAVVACCLASVAGAADWPVWLGPTGNGIAPDTGINKDWNARPPQELWRVPLSDQGFAGPSVAEGRVFIVDHQGDQDLVRALALGTGAEIWRFAYADLAEFDHGFSRATPVFVEGNLYTISYLGKVHCLNAATGEKVWMRDMPSEFGGTRPQWGYAMSAFIDGEKLIICPGGANASVAALNRLTGETIWTGGGSDIPGYATPAKVTLNGEEQYLVFAGTSFLGVAADDGELLWQVPWVNQWKVNAATPFAIGERVIFTSGYGAGCAAIEIGAQGVETKWKHTEVCARFTTPIYYNDWIFANSESGHLLCLSPETGQVAWKQPGFEWGGMVAADGTIIAVNGKGGDVVMVNAAADGYQEMGRFNPLGGQSWTAPIIAEGRLIVRNLEAIACLDLM